MKLKSLIMKEKILEEILQNRHFINRLKRIIIYKKIFLNLIQPIIEKKRIINKDLIKWAKINKLVSEMKDFLLIHSIIQLENQLINKPV
jgi:hypothetical protein